MYKSDTDNENKIVEELANKLHKIYWDYFNYVNYKDSWLNLAKEVRIIELAARLDEQDFDSTLSYDEEKIEELRNKIQKFKGDK